MRASQFLIATLKEDPTDAEVVSHKLMLRAGLIRKLASGLYSWLPMGLKIVRKVEAVVREEMNASGAQELLMPVSVRLFIPAVVLCWVRPRLNYAN